MANDLNKCMFIGRLGNDPEVRYMQNGKAVASFSIACGEKWKDQQGQAQERTEWVNCTAFGKLAEIVGEYLRKGSKVFIEGKMKTEKYKDNNGVEKYSTKIIVDNMQMLDTRQQGQQPQQQQGYTQQTPAQNQGYAPQQQPAPAYQAPAAPAQRPAPQPQQNFTPDLDDGWDSEIPF